MAKIKHVKKQVSMSHRDIVKYQLVSHCFFSDIQLSTSELNCLTLLGLFNDVELSEFCVTVVTENVFKNPQTVRNFLTKAAKLDLVYKYTADANVNKKRIQLNSDLNLQTTGSVLLDYKLFYVTKE